MSTLKLLQEQQSRTVIKPGFQASPPNDQSPDLPRARYFQIHFQHLHDNIRDVQDELKQLKHQVADLNAKLDQLTMLLIKQQGNPCLTAPRNSKKSEH